MLIVIDVGNTNITLGVYDKDDLIATFRLTTKLQRTSDEFGITLFSFLQTKDINPQAVEAVLISSVVPKIMHSLTNAIRKYFNIEPMIVGPGIKTGISVRTENPREVGADRIVDIAAAYYIYGGPALVIDFGTATTYDYVNENGEMPILLQGLKFRHRRYGRRQLNYQRLKLRSQKRLCAVIRLLVCKVVWFTVTLAKQNILLRR